LLGRENDSGDADCRVEVELEQFGRCGFVVYVYLGWKGPRGVDITYSIVHDKRVGGSSPCWLSFHYIFALEESFWTMDSAFEPLQGV